MPASFFTPLRRISTALALSAVVCLAGSVQAQDREDDEVEPIFSMGKRPFVVVAASSANQLKEKAGFVFESAGYPNAVDAVLEKLDENVNGLNGINWDRPAGVMVFLDSVIPPAFEFVAFLPMSDVGQFRNMMELGPVVMRDVPNEEGRFELITPNRDIQIRTHGDYAFIQLPPMDPDPAFDRELPNPTGLVAGLTGQFDFGVTLDVDAVPKATRDLIFNMISATMSTQMQQRDEEPDAVYAVRDAWQQRDLAGLKLFFEDTQRISLGLNVDTESSTANIDFVIQARNASDFLKEILLSSSKPSYFTPLVSDLAPISVSYSALMAERDREAGAEAVEALKGWLAMTVEQEELGQVPDEGSPLFHGITALKQTVSEGHLDLFSQIYRDANEKIAVVGALRVEDGEAVAAGLQDLLMRLRDQKDIGEIEIAHREHSGVAYHRIAFDNPDAGAYELFGAKPGFMIGGSARSIWFCIGGEGSFDVLKGVMDELVAAYDNPTERVSPAPMSITMHVSDLIELVQGAEAANRKEREKSLETDEAKFEEVTKELNAPAAKPDERQQRFQEFRERRRKEREQRRDILVETLAEGDDMIHIEFRPVDDGMRIRARFDSGFVRAVGKMIGSGITED